jgi:cyclase
MNRRTAMRLAVGSLVGTGLSRLGLAAQTIPSWRTELRELSPGIFAYTQASGPGVDNASLSNAGVIVGPDHLLAIDALGPPVHAKSFRATAMKALGKPFGRVINTHHHRDHTNGNCFFTGAEIVAHEYCREATIAQGIPARPYEDRPQWQEGMSELKLAPATTTFTGTKSYRYGDLDVQLLSLGPAHTWGDVAVYLPQRRMLFAGDIAFYYVTPPAHNGRITTWIDAIDRIMAMDVDVIVPGHGPVGTKKELAETRAYLDLMVREARPRYEANMSPGQAAADIDVGRFAAWTNPERTAWNMVRLYAEFGGTLRAETDVAAQNAAVAEYNRLKRSKG